MIYVTGDRHGGYDGFSDSKLPGQSSWTDEDTVIITGDFGYVMRGEKNCLSERNNLDELEGKIYTICFCDGNHESFDCLEQYPEEIRFGAPVRRIRHNIFWLQRGYVYTIEGKTFFVFGGAYSIDKAFRLQYQAVCGEKIWFEKELPTPEEYLRAIASLQDHNNQIDYIITHTAPGAIIPRITGTNAAAGERPLTDFLNYIYHEVSFQKWFCGHYHCDLKINTLIDVCYEVAHEI